MRGYSVDGASTVVVKVSGVVVAYNATDRLPRALPALLELCDEVIVLVDRKTTDDSREVARRFTDRVYDFEFEDTYSQSFVDGMKYARGEWILALADDETLGVEWTRFIVDEMIARSVPTHYLTPVRWIVPPGDRYLRNAPWAPCFMERMWRNIPSLYKFPKHRSHERLPIVGEGHYVADLPVDHWNFVLRSRSQREQKVKFYGEVSPGFDCGEYYLYEDAYHETLPLPKVPRPATGDRHVETRGLRHCVDVTLVDQDLRMCVREVYPVMVSVANRSNRDLVARSIGVSESDIFLTSRWLAEPDASDVVEFGTIQCPLPSTIPSGIERRALVEVKAPAAPGTYFLQFEVIEQNVAYFSRSPDCGNHEIVKVDVYERIP